jgi:hypothetical protein
MHEDNARTWRAARIADLPYPHLLWKCKWSEVWRSEFQRAGKPDEADGRQRVFDAFAAGLGPAKLRRCPYHRADWIRIARVGVALIEGGEHPTEAALSPALRQLRPADAEWLYWLFAEPIFISATQLGNGQHRVCAMRLAGVERCPIEESR